MASKKSAKAPAGLSVLRVSGFKSIGEEQSIEFAPLTLLAGANSSGKSSMMQALLLLKQTLDASFDPGALLLNGPHAKFTSAEQLFFRTSKRTRGRTFSVTIAADRTHELRVEYGLDERKRLQVARLQYFDAAHPVDIHVGMDRAKVEEALPTNLREMQQSFDKQMKRHSHWQVERYRCFLVFNLEHGLMLGGFGQGISPSQTVQPAIQKIIHVPGLRANPERQYALAAASGTYPGTFDRYTASVIASWKDLGKSALLTQLGKDLEQLGLTWKVDVRHPSDTDVELLVGRLPRPCRGGALDLVSIADVGFGVSQVLPVLVALLTAQPSQLVVLEQPELHLHPRAQLALAAIISRASARGVRVVVETHSHLLLLGLQTLVARGSLPSHSTKLHWFEREAVSGRTRIRVGTLDGHGAFADLPVDFGDVAMMAEADFLDATDN